MLRNVLPLGFAAATLILATAGSVIVPAAVLIAIGAGLAALVIARA